MSKPFKDITGQKFGRLTALYRLYNTKCKTKWLCVCDCGNLKEVYITELIRGHTKSCGCLKRDTTISRNKRLRTTHGKTHTRLFNIWDAMKKRCYNKNVNNYKDYGGRGIKICDEWLHDFQAFYDWSISNGYDDNLTIDRIDVNGNYEPNNCRWLTHKQQQRNKRNNKNYTINGVTHCLSEWCNIHNTNYKLVWDRIHIGWAIERALGLK